MTHRRWDWDWNSGYKAEHNALYDAYEAERQRADAAEKEVAEHRRHVSIQMSREAEARRALRAAEQRVRELEAQRATPPAVPPGVPSDEQLAREAFLAIRPNDTAWDYQPTHETGRWIEIVAFVRDAILAALPVLTREEVAVTEEEIAEELDDQLSMVIDMDLCKAGAAAVMSLLREKQVVQEPDPIATAETLEQLKQIGYSAFYNNDEYLDDDCHAEKIRWARAVTAILRAARPEIRIDPQPLLDTINSKMSWTAKYDLLNSRIRYRVELPPDNWKAAVDDALVCCDMTADSFGSPREAVQALLAWHTKADEWLASDDLRQRQIECYERVYVAAVTGLSGLYSPGHDSDYHEGNIPDIAHAIARSAARTLLAELTAALDEKGGA